METLEEIYSMNDMNDNYDKFDEYATKYDLNEKMIAYKYKHSYRVVHECDEIAFTLKLEEDDTYLANLIGLLHDIARFEQWKQYKSFSDLKTVDHADYGCKILFEDGLIKDYKLYEKDYELVRRAILNHNKYAIDGEGMDENMLMHAKIIRDADKLDILYSFANKSVLELEEDLDAGISEKVHEMFFEHKTIDKNYVKNKNDIIVNHIALVFDLNFKYSIGTVLDKKYLENILKNSQNKELFKPYVDEAVKYLKGKMKDVR